PLGERRAAHVRLRSRGIRAVRRRKPRWRAPRARSRLARISNPPWGVPVLDLIVYLAVAALLAVPLVAVHRASTMPAAGPAPRPGPRKVATRPAATLAPLEWPSDAAVASTPPPMSLAQGDRHASLRDRYVAARFPGIASSLVELAEPVRVIRGAR